MLEHRGPTWRHAPAVLGTALLAVATVVGTQVALAPVELGPASNPRAPLSPYGEGGFTVGVAAVDKRITITSADDGSYVLGYTPTGGDVVLDLDLLSGDQAQPWWYDAGTGRTLKMAALASAGVARFPAPKEGGGPAWVLVVDDAGAGYGSPDREVVAQATGEDGGSGSGGAGASASAASGASGTGSASTGSSDAVASDGEGDVQPGDDPASGSSPEQGRFGASGGEPGSSGSDGGSGDGDVSGGKGSGSDTGSGNDSSEEGTSEEKQPEEEKPDNGSGDEASDGDSGASSEKEDQKPDDQKPEEKPKTEAPAEEVPKEAPKAEAPEEAPEEAPQAETPKEAPKASADPSWDKLAQCESTGNWAIDSGNGYYGGLQFDKGTWSDFGGTEHAPRADQATKEQQIEIATKVRDARGGYSSWPACSSKLGLPK